MSRFKAIAAVGVTIFAASTASAHDVHTLDTLTVKAGDVTQISYPVDPDGAPATVYASDGLFWEVVSPSPSGPTGTIFVKAFKPDTCSDIFVFSGQTRLSHRLCAVK